MAEEKIRFDLSSIDIVEENIDLNHPGFDLSPDKRTNNLEIHYKVDPRKDKVIITIALKIKADDNNNPFCNLAMLNTFRVKNLSKFVTYDNATKDHELRNRQFLFFLIDNSIAHFRAIQINKYPEFFKKVGSLPYIQANKMLSKANEVSP